MFSTELHAPPHGRTKAMLRPPTGPRTVRVASAAPSSRPLLEAIKWSA